MVRKQFVHPVFKTAQWAFLIFAGGGNETLLKSRLENSRVLALLSGR